LYTTELDHSTKLKLFLSVPRLHSIHRVIANAKVQTKLFSEQLCCSHVVKVHMKNGGKILYRKHFMLFYF